MTVEAIYKSASRGFLQVLQIVAAVVVFAVTQLRDVTELLLILFLQLYAGRRNCKTSLLSPLEHR